MKLHIRILKTILVQYLFCLVGLLLLSCSSNDNQSKINTVSNPVNQVDSLLVTDQYAEKEVEVETPIAKVERILNELGDPLNVDTLILSHMNLEEIPDLSKYTNLKYLDLSHNAITNLNWRAFMKEDGRDHYQDNLEYLNLSNNQIHKGLPYLLGNNFPQLKVLNLSHNQLPFFFIGGSPSIEEGSYDFPLTTIDLSFNLLTEVQINCQYVDSILVSDNLNLSKIVLDTAHVGYIKYPINNHVNIIHSEEIPIYDEPITGLKETDFLQAEYYSKSELDIHPYYADLFTRDQLDEINAIEGSWIYSYCQVYYAPDSLFKLFEIGTERMMGYYPINDHMSYLHFNSEVFVTSIDEVEQFVKIDEGKYLILHSGGSLINTYVGLIEGGAVLISIDNKEGQNTLEISQTNVISYYQHSDVDRENILEYDEDNKRIRYGYGHNLYHIEYEEPKDTIYWYEGSYIYTNGEFIKESSKKEVYYYDLSNH